MVQALLELQLSECIGRFSNLFGAVGFLSSLDATTDLLDKTNSEVFSHF